MRLREDCEEGEGLLASFLATAIVFWSIDEPSIAIAATMKGKEKGHEAKASTRTK
jgi:hypothetical protein